MVPSQWTTRLPTLWWDRQTSLHHAAALAVANLPAEAYNPLILYGNTGLGKTHLLHAVAHRIRQHHPAWHVVYLPAASFMRELLQALRHERMEAFAGALSPGRRLAHR